MRFILSLSLILLFQSCDPLRHITVENKTEDIVHFRIYLKNSTAASTNPNLNPYFLEIPSHESESILFQIGHWDKKTLARFSNDIDSIVIEKSHEKILYNTSDELYQFLNRHRGNFLNKHAIHFIIKE